MSEPEPNPICDHPNRIHYLGGGLYVCFRCWLSLLFRGSR